MHRQLLKKLAYKFFLLQITVFGLTVSVCGQSLRMHYELDTLQQTITSTIVIQHISAKNQVRWQQRLLPEVSITALDTQDILWDTSRQILTIIWKSFPPSDTLTYSFTAKFNSEMPAYFLWGEGALLFVDKENNIQKLSVQAEYIRKYVPPLTDSIKPLDSLYYIQVGVGNKNRQGDYTLYKGDKIFAIQSDKVYKYHVGPYESAEQAKSRLSFYKKHVRDAFIVKELRK